jgi:predicted transcriptional regulator
MTDQTDSITLATELTIAWLANPNTRVDADAVPAFLASMYDTVGKLGETPVAIDEPAPVAEPAVSVRKSLASPDFIISLLDGKPYKSLTRHLNANGLTMEQYRERFGLKRDYPSVAPAYSEARRAVAMKLGLGRKPGTKVEKAAEQEKPATKARKGKSVADAKGAAKAHLGGAE